MPTPDFTMANHGTLVTFVLLTERAREWVEENVSIEPYIWFGSYSFACEYRYASNLLQGMLDAGMEQDL